MEKWGIHYTILHILCISNILHNKILQKMPKITHTTNEGWSQDLNDSSSKAVFLPVLLLHLMSLLYINPISNIMFQKQMPQQIIHISPKFLQWKLQSKVQNTAVRATSTSRKTPWHSMVTKKHFQHLSASFAANSERKSAENELTKRTKTPLNDTSLK